MIIRKATPTDARRIAEIGYASWRAAYTGKMPQELIESRTPEKRTPFLEEVLSDPANPITTWVVSDAEKVVGYSSIGPTQEADEDPVSIGEVVALYVEPEAWGRGYGKSLMDHALATLFGSDMLEVRLWCLTDNPIGRAFYERQRFRVLIPEKALELRGVALMHTRYGLTNPSYRVERITRTPAARIFSSRHVR